MKEKKLIPTYTFKSWPTILALAETLFSYYETVRSKTKLRLSALGTRMSNLKVHFISYLQKKLRVMLTKHELYLLPIEVTSMEYEITERKKKCVAFLPAAQAEEKRKNGNTKKTLRLRVLSHCLYV